MLTGNVVINGVDDKQLRTLLSVKIEHEGSLIFHPNQLQLIQPAIQPQRPGHPQQSQPEQLREQVYNNAMVSWSNEAGLKAVKQLLHELTDAKQ